MVASRHTSRGAPDNPVLAVVMTTMTGQCQR